MALELSLPILALSGAVVTALSYRFWPRIAVRTYREKQRGFGIREIAVSIWRPGRALQAAPARFEFVIYVTLKSCNP